MWMPLSAVLHRRQRAGLQGHSVASLEGDSIHRAKILGQEEIGI